MRTGGDCMMKGEAQCQTENRRLVCCRDVGTCVKHESLVELCGFFFFVLFCFSSLVLSVKLSFWRRLPDQDNKCASALQPSTLHVWRDGAFLNSCGDFVAQARCRGNMSHLRQTWVGSHLEINCVFPTRGERQTFHWPPSWRMFLGFSIYSAGMLVWFKRLEV